jgi:hypothetical protein
MVWSVRAGGMDCLSSTKSHPAGSISFRPARRAAALGQPSNLRPHCSGRCVKVYKNILEKLKGRQFLNICSVEKAEMGGTPLLPMPCQYAFSSYKFVWRRSSFSPLHLPFSMIIYPSEYERKSFKTFLSIKGRFITTSDSSLIKKKLSAETSSYNLLKKQRFWFLWHCPFKAGRL